MKQQAQNEREWHRSEAREAKNLEAEVLIKKIEAEEKLEKDLEALANQ